MQPPYGAAATVREVAERGDALVSVPAEAHPPVRALEKGAALRSGPCGERARRFVAGT